MVDLREEKASPDFLGYTFRWQSDRYGRKQRYLHVGPSKPGFAAGAGADQRDDGSPSRLHADHAADCKTESTDEGMGRLLLMGISA